MSYFALQTPATGSGGGGTSSTFGAAFPATGTAAGFLDTNGDMSPGNLDSSGNVLIAGTLTVTPATSATANGPSLQTIGTGNVQIIAANSSRVGGSPVQNAGTTTLYFRLGATAATTSVYSFYLAPGQSWNWMVGSALWLGAVQCISSAAGGKVNIEDCNA